MSGETLRDTKLFVNYKNVITLFQTISKVIGLNRALDISDVTFKFNVNHVVDYFFVLYYVFSVIYIMCTKFDNKMQILRPLTLFPIAIQTTVKLSTFLSNIKLIKQLHQFNLNLYGNARGNWQKCLDTWLRRFQQVSIFHISVHWFAIMLLVCYPLYGYFVLGVMVPFFDVVMPFVDDTTVSGYFITLVFQLALSVIVISIMYSVDYVFILTLFTGAAIIDLIEEDCRALTFAIQNANATVDAGKISDLLIIAIRRNQNMRRYLHKVCAIFENGSLIQLYCGGLCLCICLFVAKMSEWFVVYFIALSALYQMALYCLMGTMIEWKSNHLCVAVYDVPWYKLCISQQKVFKYFLQMSQSTIKVTIMGSMTLNVETGMAILKSIYSLYILIDKMY